MEHRNVPGRFGDSQAKNDKLANRCGKAEAAASMGVVTTSGAMTSSQSENHCPMIYGRPFDAYAPEGRFSCLYFPFRRRIMGIVSLREEARHER